MKAIVRIAALALALSIAALGGGSCSKNIGTSEELTPSHSGSDDPTAGAWRNIVISSPTQFTVPPPAPATSDTYKAELATIKTAQSNLTDAQRDVVQHWSGGGVLRWNQILRELVARYNLPPAPRGDQTYPAPDASNPFADPQFPFSNPPYAARAYSYVSVAQYEALKVAWHYKYQFGRPSPSKVDGAIQALIPSGDLPAYPSEDAVLSGVTAEMLRLLFPAAVEEITRRAAEQREAALLSGRAAPSDIAAGLALGQAVAPVIIARAGSDGMRNAIGTPAQWAAFATAAKARGEMPWVSLDGPPRPPMLPNFGQVRAWMMTPQEVVAERPPAPPSTSSAQMQQETAEVKETLRNLTREQLAIAYKWNDGAGTYTPPGHWNDIAAEYIRDAHFSEVRAARAYALVNMALHDAAVGCWNAKYFYFNPRPTTMDPTIKTAIGIPNFPSYPSGHSTFSASAATVLKYLFPAGAADFDKWRDEAGISRLYGGIHYRVDIDQGKDHGILIGGYTVRFAQADGAND